MDSKNFPKPPPDRRKNIPTTQISAENENKPQPKQLNNKIYQVLKKNVGDIRNTLNDFKILKKDCISNPKISKSIPDFINLILFGPTGSGKSSLIK